jgi:hypothetical protein
LWSDRRICCGDILTLDVTATCLVLAPKVTTTNVIPAQQGDVAAFHAFAMICRSKTIYLHFSRSQLLNDDLPRIRAFASALRAHSSNAAPFEYAGLNAGRWVQATDWAPFEQTLEPPPYRQNVSTHQVLSKRCQDSSLPCGSSVDEPALSSPLPP